MYMLLSFFMIVKVFLVIMCGLAFGNIGWGRIFQSVN